MAKTLTDITDGEIEKALKPLLKTVHFSASKFSVRQTFIDLLKENGINLSNEERICLHIGDDSDEYSKRINKVMTKKGYLLSTHSYDKLQF